MGGGGLVDFTVLYLVGLLFLSIYVLLNIHLRNSRLESKLFEGFITCFLPKA